MPAAAQTSVPSVYWRLSPPVVIVTHGRGREVFRDSRELFKRLAEIPTVKDRVAAIWCGDLFVAEPGVDALGAMLETAGLTPFFRVCKAAAGPERLIRSKWCWDALGNYLRLSWRSR